MKELSDGIFWRTEAEVFKFRDPDGRLSKMIKDGSPISALGEPYEVKRVSGNVGLKSGIQHLIEIITGINLTPVLWDASHAYIGVGNDNTAAADTQTKLMAEVNGGSFTYAAMDPGFPQRVDEKSVFRASFLSGQAVHDWLEWTIANGNDGTKICINRKVDNMGTKPAFDLWILQLSLRWGSA